MQNHRKNCPHSAVSGLSVYLVPIWYFTILAFSHFPFPKNTLQTVARLAIIA